ncbi:MAG: hypothetical protein GY870_14835 [archaeon]|nr:hypothetical protein [archaeon]
MGFTFYSTFYSPLTNQIPITVDYSINNRKKLDELRAHRSKIMVHSGNWWSIKNPELRTPERLSEGVEKIYKLNKKSNPEVSFMGYMTLNEQPYSILSKEGKRILPYWIENHKLIGLYNEKCLKNATWALDNNIIPVPIYCTLQPVNYEQSKRYFKEALEIGHKYFSIGVSEYLKYPKYKFEGIKRIFEILKGAREVLDQKYPIHLSGLSSFKLIPLIKYLGANSCDGSTPVQSALAYGTVFNSRGTGASASNLKKLILFLKERPNVLKIPEETKKTGVLKWFDSENGEKGCSCKICHLKTKKQRIIIFNEGYESYKPGETRIIHNLFVWNSLIKRINLEMVKDPDVWIESFINEQGSHYSKKVFNIAKEVKDAYL